MLVFTAIAATAIIALLTRVKAMERVSVQRVDIIATVLRVARAFCACELNRYGRNCANACNCSARGTCDPRDGSCSCFRGYKGENCEKRKLNSISSGISLVQ